MQTNCILVASNFATFPHTDWKQIFLCHCSFSYILFRSICVTENSLQQTSVQCLYTINMVFSDEHKISDKKIICNQYKKRLTIFNTKNIKICRRITKLEAIKMQFVCIFCISAEYVENLIFLISQGSVATCLRLGGYYGLTLNRN